MASIVIELSPELERELAAAAAERGEQMADFVRSVLKEKVGGDTGTGARHPAGPKPASRRSPRGALAGARFTTERLRALKQEETELENRTGGRSG